MKETPIYVSANQYNYLFKNIIEDIKEIDALLQSDDADVSKMDMSNIKFELEMLKLCLDEHSQYDALNDEYVINLISLNKDRLIGYLLVNLETREQISSKSSVK